MTRREWQIGGPILLALALCVAAFMWGTHLRASIEGPVAMRSFASPGGNRLAVVSNKTLQVLDGAGRRISRQDLMSLGLTESPNDMDWTVDAHQNIEAWFLDDAAVTRVVRCAWRDSDALLTQCRTAMSGPQLKVVAQSRAVHLAVDIAGGRVFIADAKGDRVQVFDLNGKLLAQSRPDTVPLYFPNRLRYLGDDLLAVADNDHRRLVWLKLAQKEPARQQESLYSASHSQARAGRGKVTDAAFGADGTLWMIAMKQGQKDGDVLVFDGHHKPVARAALPQGADPIIVETLGDVAVVADFSLPGLYRVNATGGFMGEFGDSGFRSELATLRARSQSASIWTSAAVAVAVAIVLAGLLLGWKFGERPRPVGQLDEIALQRLASLAEAGPGIDYPVVIQQTAAYRAAIRWQVALLGAVMILSLGALAWLVISAAGNRHVAPHLWWIAAACGIVAVGMYVYILAAMLRKVSLQVSKDQVTLVQGATRLAAELKDVHASSQALLVGSRMVRFRQPALTGRRSGVAVFDIDVLERAVLARLPAQNLVDNQRLTMLALRKMPAWQKGLLLFSVLVFVALQAWRIFR